MKVIDKETGKEFTANYGITPSGNKRMWVDGKFYSDKQFDKKFAKLDLTGFYILVKGKWVEKQNIIK